MLPAPLTAEDEPHQAARLTLPDQTLGPKGGNADTFMPSPELPDGMHDPGKNAFVEAVPGLAQREYEIGTTIAAIVAQAIQPEHYVSAPFNLTTNNDLSIAPYAKIIIILSGAAGVTVKMRTITFEVAASSLAVLPTLKSETIQCTAGSGVAVFSSRYEDGIAIRGSIT